MTESDKQPTPHTCDDNLALMATCLACNELCLLVEAHMESAALAALPSTEGQRGEWWIDAAVDVARHARASNPPDWDNAIKGGLLRAYNRGKDDQAVAESEAHAAGVTNGQRSTREWNVEAVNDLARQVGQRERLREHDKELCAMPGLWRHFANHTNDSGKKAAYRVCADRLDGWLQESALASPPAAEPAKEAKP